MRRMTLVTILALLAVLPSAPAFGGSSDHQSADVLTFAGFDDVGDATLVRTDNGVSVRAVAEGADAGLYTMWWVVWNTPEGCFVAFACDEPDLFNPNAGLAIGYAGGAAVSHSGRLGITAHLSEGATLTGFPVAEFSAIGVQLTHSTLVDSRHAEVHLVLRTHEEKIVGLVGEMMHTFNGGCVYDPPIDGSEPAYGTPGPNACTDLYFAVFASAD